MDEYFYSVGEKRAGPVSGHELKQAANRGDIGPDDLVWMSGWNEWHKASRVPDLMPVVRDDRGKGRHSPPETRPAKRGNHTATLFDCPKCSRAHFVDAGPCPSASDAAREVAIASRQTAAA